MRLSTTLQVTLASLGLLAVGFYYLIDRLLERVERQYLEAAEEPMVDAANVLAGLLEATLKADGTLDVAAFEKGFRVALERQLNARIYLVDKNKVEMGAYVVNADGVCVFDSSGIETGRNLMSYRDVALTFAGHYGARSSRVDEKDDRSSVMFVAAPVRHEGRVAGVVSVFKPQRSMFEFIARTRSVIRVMGWGMFGLISAGVVLLSVWLLRPIGKLTSYAKAVTAGQRVPLPKLGALEAATLGRAFEGMRDALEDRNYVETYVQSLTHEMKSPIAAIRGAAELAAEDHTPPEARNRFLGNIRVETERMQRIIERLLALAEIESRKTLQRKTNFNLGTLVHQVCEGLQPAFVARGINLRCQSEINVMVSGDPMLLEMAVDNLLQNALEFSSPNTQVEVNVRLADGSAEVVVEDEGPGIPDYALSRVFERFYSLQHPATGRKSSGLGLCFVKEAAQLHGGTAHIENRRDHRGVSAVLRVRV